jgi:hypothetical protein
MIFESCCVLTKKDELQLTVFERKVIRKIFGPIRDTDQWRRRCNEGLYQLHAEPEIVKWIRSERLRWAGHIVRMRQSHPARKSTFDLFLGERTVRRPKRRWTEEVERELKGMGVKDWKRLALERDKWKKIWRRPRPKLDFRAKEREREIFESRTSYKQ